MWHCKDFLVGAVIAYANAVHKVSCTIPDRSNVCRIKEKGNLAIFIAGCVSNESTIKVL